MLFLNPLKVRSEVTLRGKKRNELIEKIRKVIGVVAEDSNAIFKGKAVVQLKIHTCTQQDVLCYFFDGVPLVFIHGGRMFPTDLLICNVIREQPFGNSINLLQKSSICFVSAISGETPHLKCSQPFAVGTCSIGAAEINTVDSKETFISILHTAQDKLAEFCPPDILASYELQNEVEVNCINAGLSTDNVVSKRANRIDSQGELSGDELLMFCFISALYSLEISDLPLPVNIFYAKHMKSNCPNGEKLDIKTTSYKKVNIFLEHMADEGYITLESVDIGVKRLTAFQKHHPKLNEIARGLPQLHRLENNSSLPKFTVDDFYFGPPVFEEVRIINSLVSPFFASAGYSTGDNISLSDIYRLVGAYIDSNHLRDLNDRDLVSVNALLTRVCEPNLLQESPESTLAKPCFQITFRNLIKSLTKGLTSAYRITYPLESKLPSVIVMNRSNIKLNLYESKQRGKDVTRIAGLDHFGIDLKRFVKYIQTKLSCSASLKEDSLYPNTMVVQTQGSHRIVLSKILTETFGFPKNWIQGYKEPEKNKKSDRKSTR